MDSGGTVIVPSCSLTLGRWPRAGSPIQMERHDGHRIHHGQNYFLGSNASSVITGGNPFN